MNQTQSVSRTKIKNQRILQAVNFEELDRPPVWMMRQAGRYLPEYQAIRSQMSFLELCKNPQKAAEVSVQPLDILGVDAIIMFSDILVPLEPMGADLSFDTGKPEFRTPLRTPEQVNKLVVPDCATSCDFVYETIHQIKSRITTGGEQEVPVLGFAGAPWTLASYLIEGGGSKNFENIKKFMYSEPSAMHDLLEKLAQTVTQYLILKVENGADMLQLFDTWASMMNQDDYKTFALPYQQKIISAVKEKYPDIKFTLYVNGVANVLDYMLESGADTLSVDWRVNLADIRNYLIDDLSGKASVAVQGNFDPCKLLGPKERVIEETHKMLAAAGNEPGYIANLGHGILPMVPVDNAKAFIDTVQQFRY